MENIKMKQHEKGRNDWLVIADTKRFGDQEIVFEGTYDEAMAYIEKVEFEGYRKEKFTVHITGEHCGCIFDNDWLIIHKNGFEEQDWGKLGF